MNNRVTCSCGWSWNKSDSSKKDMYVCHQCGKDNTMKDGGWLNKFEDAPEAQNGIEGTMGGLTDKGFNYNGAWGGTMEYGGDIPQAQWGFQTLQSYLPIVQKFLSKTASNLSNKPAPNPVTGKIHSRESDYGGVNDLYNKYFGQPLKTNTVQLSKYRPTKEKDKSSVYYSVNDDLFKKQIVDEALGMGLKLGETKLARGYQQPSKEYKELLEKRSFLDKLKEPFYQFGVTPSENEIALNAAREKDRAKVSKSAAIGGHQVSRGSDERGEYISYYDKFDRTTGTGSSTAYGTGHPFEIYDKIYIDPKTGKPKLAMGGSIPGSVGLTYARTQSPAPSNGPYAKKTKASAQRGKNVKPIDNSNITNEVINYTKEYMNSPMYKQMLSASAKNEDDANTIQLNRNLNLDSTVVNFPEKQRQYNLYGDSKSSGLVNIYPLAQRDNITGNVIAHEVSHSVDRPISSRNRIIPQSDIDLISEYSNSKGRLFDRFSKYTALPTETRAQLNNIRYDAKSSNLYDPFTEKVTPEILEKIKNSKTKNGYDDLKDIYSDDQIINLLNTISKNNQPSQEFPIAQNGMEMKYYQEGLDWKPKNISKDGGWLSKYEGGGIIEDDMGQWAHPGEITKINSNQITMQGVNYPVLGISDTGDTKMMQPGEDYKFKGKSVTEIPMAQKGKVIPLKDLLKQEDEKLKGKADNTRVVQPVRQQPKVLIDPLTGKPPTANRQNIVRATANPRNQGTIQTPYKRSFREQAIADLNIMDRRGDNAVASIVTAPIKAGLNLLRPDKYFDDVNSTSSLGDAVMSLGLDALTAIPAFEVASEASRYLGVPRRLGVLASDAKELGSNFLGINPASIPLAEQELINTFRNVGHIAKKTGASAKAEQFEALLKQGESLSDEMFFNLTGYNRSDVINKIGTLKQTESSGLKNFLADPNDRYAAQLDRDAARLNRANAIERASTGGPSAAEMRSAFQQNYNPSSQEQIVASLTDDLVNGRITQTQFQNNLEAQGIDMAAYLRGASVDDATNYAQQTSNSQLLDNLIGNVPRSESMQFLDDLSAQVSSGTITEAEYMDRMSEYMRNRPPSPSYFDRDPVKNSSLSMYENATRSPIGRLNDKFFGNKYIPKTELADNTNDLFIGLYTNQYNNPGLEMRSAYNKVAASPKGSSFLPASSLSSDSYPMSLRLTNRGLKSGIVDVNYHGLSPLNSSGFTQAAGMPMDINLKEINTLIKGLNTQLPKSLPYAKIEGGQLMYPNFSVTRKKNGGWLNKYK